MEDHDQRKNHSSGHETPHVHHCHKCGWPFPNHHPSAKQRRAHKKICGTIEGYKLEVGDSTHSNVSDDEHSDHGYRTPPSAKTLESKESQKGSGGTGEKSNQSEDEVFSDAVSNFADAAAIAEVGGVKVASESGSFVEKVSKDVSQCGATAEGTPAGDSTDSTRRQTPLAGEDTADELGRRPDSADRSTTVIDTCIDSPEQSNGALKDGEDDSKADSLIVKSESFDSSLAEVKDESETDFAGEAVLENVSQESKEIKVIKEIVDTPDMMSKQEEPREISTVSESTRGFDQLDKTSCDMLVSEVAQSALPPGDKSSEHASVREIEAVDSCNVEEHYEKGEMEGNSHVFSVPHDVPVVEHPEKLIEGFKYYTMMEQAQPDNPEFSRLELVDSFGLDENRRKGEEEGKFTVFSVPQNVPVVEHPEKLIEGFKDYKNKGWVQHDNLDLPKSVEERSDASCPDSDVLSDVHALKDRSETERMTTCLVVDEEVLVKSEVFSEKNITGVHDSQGPNQSDYLKDTVIVEVEKYTTEKEEESDAVQTLSDTTTVFSPLENETPGVLGIDKDDNVIESKSAVETSYISEDDRSQKDMWESSVKSPAVPGSVGKTEVTDAVEDSDNREALEEISVEIHTIRDPACIETARTVGDNAEIHIVPDSVSKIVTPQVVENGDSKKGVGEDSVDIHTILDSVSVTETAHTAGENVEMCRILDSASNIGTSHTAGDDIIKEAVEERIVEGPVVPESSDKLVAVQVNLVDQSIEGDASFHHEDEKGKNDIIGMESRDIPLGENLSQKSTEIVEDVQDVTENKTNGSEAETVSASRGSDSKEVKDGDEVNGKDKLCHAGNDGLDPVPSEDQSAGVALLTLGTVPAVQTPAAVEDGHDCDLNVPRSSSLQGEHENNYVKQHLTASALDASVASSSRSESLDANWGSVSVLSGHSDTLALADDSRETSDAGKPYSRQGLTESEVRHSDKPEAVEPPSFMTLVEPAGTGDGPSSVAKQNQGQPGWFPSLAHSSNDSPGRKKNEEIIAKVTNWSNKQQPQQQHSPLKSLLVEANCDNKPRSPSPKQSANVVSKVQLDESKDVGKDNGAVGLTVGSMLLSDAPAYAKAEAKTMNEEWNSPARYPIEIKREKSKAKGRPYWVQFVCCTSSSAN